MAASTYLFLAGLIYMILSGKVNCGDEDARLGTIPLLPANELDSLTQHNEHVLAFFYKDGCTSQVCIKAEEEVELAAKHSTLHRLKVVKLDDERKAKEYGIPKFPNLIFFRNGSPNLYPEDEMDVESVMEWMEGARDDIIRVLDDDTFEHLTQAATGATTGDWLIIFYDSRCSSYLPTFSAVSMRLRQRAVVGRVDMSRSPGLVKRFKITKCPTIKFFRLGNMYDFTLPKADVTTLVNFAEGWYKNSRAVKVPGEQSPFDRLVESVVLILKDHVTSTGYTRHLIAVLVVLLLAIVFLFMHKSKREKID